MKVLGIDEAGRGPVVGPMVVAGAMIEEKNLPILEKIDVKDSKLLSPAQRRAIAKELVKVLDSFEVRVIGPELIDQALNDPHSNLNKLELATFASITNQMNPDKVIVDCPSVNDKKFLGEIKQKLDHKRDVIAEHKADSKYLIVGAASILAKERREEEIKKIKDKIGIDFGSGYLSDPRTSIFMQQNFKTYPEIFRKTWAPYKELMSGKHQKKLDEF